MRTRHRTLRFFGFVTLTGFAAFTLAMGRTPDVIGKVVSSANATVGGTVLLSNDTILSGDAVKVGEGGSVLLSFSPTGRAALGAATCVQFGSVKGKIEAQLLSGTLAVYMESKGAFVVKRYTHRFEPQGEGIAEFRVELLPDQGTLVETQHGQVEITETRSGESYTLAEGLRAEIPASGSGIPGQNEEASNVIGKAVIAEAATRNRNPLSAGETVLENDLISTGASGRAIIQISPTNQVTLNENTSGRLTRIVERVWLRLEKGTVVADGKGDSYVLIATAKFQIAANTAGASKIYVGVLGDNSTYIESLTGDVTIQDIQLEQSYLLLAGQSAMVPENASGVPGLQPLPATAPPTPAPPPPPGAKASNPPPSPALKPHSHTAIIIVGVAAGVGAVAAAALSGGGGARSVSPSAP